MSVICSLIAVLTPASTLISEHSNNVLQTRMILNAGNLVMAMVFVVSSIFGMNLSDDHQESYVLFTLVSTTWCSILMLHTTTVLDSQG